MKKIFKNKYFVVAFKIAILFFSYIYIYFRLADYNKIDFFLPSENILFLIFSIILMPLNWLFEAVKWKFLLTRIEKISLSKSLKAVFSGVTFSVFTPNRVGELAGRVFVLMPHNRVEAVFVTWLSGFAQLIVTIFLGLFSFIILSFCKVEILSFVPANFSRIHIGFSFLIIIISLTVYFRISLFAKYFSKIKILKSLLSKIEILQTYSFLELCKLLAYSFLRYFVFFLQFYLLLVFFKVEISFLNSFFGISLMYAAMSVVPTFALSEIGVRGSAGLFFIGLFSICDTGILSASILLWIINLALPALIGSVLFYRTKI